MKKEGRIRIIFFVFFGIGLLMIMRLYFLQIVKHEKFVDDNDKQQLKTSGKMFGRGSIFFETKDGTLVSAATEKTTYILTINPSLISDPENVFENLNTITEIDKESFLAKATKPNDPYEEIKKRVSEEDTEKIRNLKIKGVSMLKEKWRFYPGENRASHVIGFVAFNQDELSGRYGVERQYEKNLRRDSQNLYSNFFVEIFSNVKDTLVSKDGEADIVLTIEPTVQETLEKTLKDVHAKWSSSETGGIIVDPHTGEIIALVSLPDFDLNNFSKVPKEDVRIFSNPLVEEVREMGSIIKPITVAIGLNEKAVSRESSYFDSGSVTLNTETVYNFDKKGRGQITLQEALGRSLNTGMVYTMQKIGREKFGSEMKKFFDGKTNIDLPNEAKNIITNLDAPRDIELATASFGQGIALTPVSTVRALSVLANGGFLVTPHVVKKIQFKNGVTRNFEEKDKKQIISKESSEEVSRMLVTVVDDYLLDGKAKNEHYTVAAKTGTAQIADSSGGYYEDRYLHSFFGYFPAYEPKFLVFLYTVYPKGVSFAANTLANPFLDTSKFLINYYEIPPDR